MERAIFVVMVLVACGGSKASETTEAYLLKRNDVTKRLDSLVPALYEGETMKLSKDGSAFILGAGASFAELLQDYKPDASALPPELAECARVTEGSISVLRRAFGDWPRRMQSLKAMKGKKRVDLDEAERKDYLFAIGETSRQWSTERAAVNAAICEYRTATEACRGAAEKAGAATVVEQHKMLDERIKHVGANMVVPMRCPPAP